MTAEPHVPTHRRTLSGKLVPRTETVIPWLEPGYVAPASHAVERAAKDRLTVEQHAAFLTGDLDAFLDLVEDELTRQPLNARARRRAQVRALVRKRLKGQRAKVRAFIAQEAAKEQPSRQERRYAERQMRRLDDMAAERAREQVAA